MRCVLNYKNERIWERQYLKKKCTEAGIEEEFHAYQMRLSASYLKVFLLLYLFLVLIHSISLLSTSAYPNMIYIDVGFYVMSIVFVSAVLSLNFNLKWVTKHECIMYVTSVVTVLEMIAVDLFTNLYHYYEHDWITGSFYDSFIILMIYMFLPIPYILPALALGTCVSLIYSIYFFLYISLYRYEKVSISQYYHLASDLSHYFCLNLVGSFFRIIREIILRSSFLDRHQYVMQDIWLRNAREQEKIFLHSILPSQIAEPIQDDIRNRIKFSEKHRYKAISHNRDHIMAIQIHPDVSILYADVVNYTHLTTTLPVQSLVTLLHELYARFDMAASQFSVQRIKFLGDCYYCVAGLIKPDPDHAKNCVDLGLCMIENIRILRDQEEVEIDIRVGVHSGGLFAGVLGATKLQYDIWGSDVIIANHLEATGVPGYIHASERTLQMITDSPYTVLPGTQAAINDPYLSKRNIITFLVTGTSEIFKFDDVERESQKSLRSLTSNMNLNDRQNTIKQELHEEFKKMPVGPQSVLGNRLKKLLNIGKDPSVEKDLVQNRSIIGLYLLHFRDPRLEYDYMRQPDYMLKYSILLAWSIGVCLVYMQIVYENGRIKISGFVDGLVVVSLSILLLITWYKKLCLWRYSTKTHKYTKFSCCIFRIAEIIQGNLIIRMCIFMYTIILYFAVISVMMMDCDKDDFEVLYIESKLYHYEPDFNMCFHPWVVTNLICLIISMTLIFTRIPFMMKIIVSTLEAITTNPFYISEYAHCILVSMALLSLHLKERQTEFNNKINYKWRVELIKKQHDAFITDQSILILLHNILPAHVVDVYLTSLAKHELYYENYEMVAVMFASLKNFEMDLPNLRVLNEIISEFDRILSYYKDDYSVEKIKIVGCTYMAACGLDVRLTSAVSEDRRTTHDSVLQEVLRARRSIAVMKKSTYEKRVRKDEVVFVLTTFALDLMRTLWMCNKEYKNIPMDRGLFSANMSIGISSGEVMAGVVGASQVHYDIWGNAVNMASRMDSTGVAGYIQVTEETAEMLRRYGLQCDYRGMTFVKGRGILPTYFVAVDTNYDFKFIERNQKNSEESLETEESSENE